MRTIIFILLVFAFSACNKDKFTTVPQVTFKEFKPDNGNSLPTSPQPYLVIEVTDGEGDLDTDSASINIKNTLTGQEKLYRFPNLSTAAGSNFKGDVQIGLKDVMGGTDATPGHPAPFVDTISFEVFVIDKAKNKSNVIIASPFYYYTL